MCGCVGLYSVRPQCLHHISQLVNTAAYLVAHRHPTHLMYPCLLFQMTKNRRCGDAADMQTWSEEFFRVLFKYRAPSDKNFGKRCKNGTASICSVHFEEVCIQRTSKMSWLKYGALPSKNMPQKSVATKSSIKRRSIVKHELPVKTKRVSKYKTLDEIQSHFWSLETVSSHWELKFVAAENIASSSTAIPSKSFLRLSFWNPCNYKIRAVPTYTIFIYSDFKFLLMVYFYPLIMIFMICH